MKTTAQIMKMSNDKRVAYIRKNFEHHHTAWKRGYVSRKCDGIAQEYHGRYGDGWVILTPSWKSTEYCHVEYYINSRNGA